MIRDFRKRFWVSLIITILILVFSPMIQDFFGYNFLLPGNPYILLALSSFVYFWGGWPFLKGFWGEIKKASSGMMTLIAMAISVSYFNTHRIDYRIVNIHQPHVRPIVRRKENAKTEFGSKIQMSLVGGFAFLDHLSWEAFNEGGYLIDSVKKYKSRFGFYPAEVLADQIYCTRDNRKQLKLLDIKLIAKPLGRPSAQAVKVHLSPGERRPN